VGEQSGGCQPEKESVAIEEGVLTTSIVRLPDMEKIWEVDAGKRH
jgi:hypothetical protein